MTTHDPCVAAVAIVDVETREVPRAQTVSGGDVIAVLGNPARSPVVAGIAWGRGHVGSHAVDHLEVVKVQSVLC